MGDKVALPSLSLPKQRTHWSVFVVIAASVLFVVMCGALYMVLERQKAAEAAFAKRQEDRKAELEAGTRKAEAERAASEAKKKETEATTAAAAAAAAAAKKAPPVANAGDDPGAAKKKIVKKGPPSKTAKGPDPKALLGPGAPTPPTPAKPPASKASKDIDDLLRGFK